MNEPKEANNIQQSSTSIDRSLHRRRMEVDDEVHPVVIVGGGICGLATALALHRKGVSSLVLEKSASLRATGGAVGVWANGWRVLEQLQLAAELREKAVLLTGFCEKWLDHKEPSKTFPVSEECRFVLRKDLIESLASKLPPASMRFGHHVVGVTAAESNDVASFSVLHTNDGRDIKAKVVLGCDGWNSAVAEHLGLAPAAAYRLVAIQGLAAYPQGHGAGDEFLHVHADGSSIARIPVNPNLLYFFVWIPAAHLDSGVKNDKVMIKKLALEKAKEYPPEFADMVLRCDLGTMSSPVIRYHAPWNLVAAVSAGKFQRGGVTVAGDAMHAMGPFLGQGTGSSLEDAVVLARRVGAAIADGAGDQDGKLEAAQRMYVKERRARVMVLATESYLSGSAISASSWVERLFFLAALAVFRRFFTRNHVCYDCGDL